MYEPVVEAAKEHEIVDVGASSPRPPHHVMGLGMAASAARWEPTLAIAGANRPSQTRWRLTDRPPEPERFPVVVLDQQLQVYIAREPSERWAVDHATGERRHAIHLELQRTV